MVAQLGDGFFVHAVAQVKVAVCGQVVTVAVLEEDAQGDIVHQGAVAALAQGELGDDAVAFAPAEQPAANDQEGAHHQSDDDRPPVRGAELGHVHFYHHGRVELGQGHEGGDDFLSPIVAGDDGAALAGQGAAERLGDFRVAGQFVMVDSVNGAAAGDGERVPVDVAQDVLAGLSEAATVAYGLGEMLKQEGARLSVERGIRGGGGIALRCGRLAVLLLEMLAGDVLQQRDFVLGRAEEVLAVLLQAGLVNDPDGQPGDAVGHQRHDGNDE